MQSVGVVLATKALAFSNLRHAAPKSRKAEMPALR